MPCRNQKYTHNFLTILRCIVRGDSEGEVTVRTGLKIISTLEAICSEGIKPAGIGRDRARRPTLFVDAALLESVCDGDETVDGLVSTTGEEE